VVPAREGFPTGYGCVRDRAGNMYWADRGAPPVVKERSPGGKVTAHAVADFRDVRWMTAAPGGTLFLIDDGDLRRVSPDGRAATVAARLSSQDPPPAGVRDRHHHMGLWTDGTGAVYVAVAGDRVVLRVRAGGKAAVAARSPDGWAPSGDLCDRDGTLWVLEYSSSLFRPAEPRVRRIDRDGKERIYESRGQAPAAFRPTGAARP
jgi:hypothetical protein